MIGPDMLSKARVAGIRLLNYCNCLSNFRSDEFSTKGCPKSLSAALCSELLTMLICSMFLSLSFLCSIVPTVLYALVMMTPFEFDALTLSKII